MACRTLTGRRSNKGMMINRDDVINVRMDQGQTKSFFLGVFFFL